MQTRLKDEDGLGVTGEFIGDEVIPGLDVVDDDDDDDDDEDEDDDEEESDSDDDEPPVGMQARRQRPRPGEFHTDIVFYSDYSVE